MALRAYSGTIGRSKVSLRACSGATGRSEHRKMLLRQCFWATWRAKMLLERCFWAAMRMKMLLQQCCIGAAERSQVAFEIAARKSCSVCHYSLLHCALLCFAAPLRSALRLARSLGSGRRALAAEVDAHCVILGCDREQAQSHLLAALAYLSAHLEQFSEQAFARVCASCLDSLEGLAS